MFSTQDDIDPLSVESSTGSGPDVERVRRQRLIEVGTLAMFAIASLATYRLWMPGVTSLVIGLAVAVFAFGLNLVWLRMGAPIERAGNMSIGIFFGLILTSVISTGGFYDPTFAWLYAIPMGAALLVDVRSSCFWTAIVIATTLGFWGLAESNIELPKFGSSCRAPRARVVQSRQLNPGTDVSSP